MKVLSIDPGYGRCGVAVLEKENGKEILKHSDCIETNADDTFSDRLAIVGEHIEKLLDDHSPSAVAIEKLFFNTNQKTAFQIAEVRGMILYIAKRKHLEIFEYTPLQVKIAITGNGVADKKQMLSMLPKLISLPNKKMLDDEYDAVAVGVCCLASVRDI
jgi:crossover junction endodeoxyribonuclease RuvC